MAVTSFSRIVHPATLQFSEKICQIDQGVDMASKSPRASVSCAGQRAGNNLRLTSGYHHSYGLPVKPFSSDWSCPLLSDEHFSVLHSAQNKHI